MTCVLEQLLGKADTIFPWLRARDVDLLVTICERLLRAIWHAHGNAMAGYLGVTGLDSPAPPGSVSTADVDDFDLPF